VAVKPFVDRSENSLGSVSRPHVTGGIDTSLVDRFRQGVSVRDPNDFSQMLIPYVSSQGFPASSTEKFSPFLEISNYGQPKLFEDPSPAKKPGFQSGPGPAPFDDISGINDPVAYLVDPGVIQYPTVLLSPNWLDPAQMDSIIEPLAIRHKMSNTNGEGPFTAHDIRASMSPDTGEFIESRNVAVESFLYFDEFETKSPPYFDSQDLAFSGSMYESLRGGQQVAFSIPGYSAYEPTRLAPFDDTINLNRTTINFSDFNVAGAVRATGQFIDDPRVGTFGKAPARGFTYADESFTTVTVGSGNRFVNGSDSVAFGGLLK
jgi:hypothetical protein